MSEPSLYNGSLDTIRELCSETQGKPNPGHVGPPPFPRMNTVTYREGANLILPQWALINSEAANNFIDVKVARALQIRLRLKPTSVIVEMIDKSHLLSGPVMQATVFPPEAIL